jgi:predicted O-methyltransferase YrrM
MLSIVESDAHEQVAKMKGPVDVAFLDAEKSGYVDS